MNIDLMRRQFYENFTEECTNFNRTVTPSIIFNWFAEKMRSKTRSNAQNNALHLYFSMIADQLNNAGYTFTNALGLEIPFTMTLIKESIWKPTQKDMFGIDSTTKLTTQMINELIDVFSKHFGERGIYVEFPSFQAFLNKLDSNY